MITLSKGEAEQGLSYFSSDDYYSVEAGEWFGKCAEELGLSGEIKREDFNNILRGCDTSGNGIVKNASTLKKTIDKPVEYKSSERERVAYNDVTFSPPKSVSLVAVIDERVKNAHRIAVQKMLLEFEMNYSLTRTGPGGIRQYNTGNLAVAKFEHFDSREMDPQLHTHCLVMNMTKRDDGKYGAFENKNIIADRKFLDLMYQAHLTRELHALGYDTRRSTRTGINGGSVESFELSCISDEIIEEYSQRTAQVKFLATEDTEQLERWEKLESRYESGEITEKGYKAEKRALIEWEKLTTRDRKRKSDAEKARPNIHATVCERLSHITIPAEVSDYEFEERKLVCSQNGSKKALRAVQEVVAAMEKTQSVLERKALIRETLIHSRGQGITADEVISAIPLFTQKLPSGDYTTRRLLEAAVNSVALADTGKRKAVQYASRDVVNSYLEAQELRDVIFAESQRDTIARVCQSRDQVNIIQGNAGSGKTFAVKHIRAILESEGYTLRGLAPTGKASSGLKSAVSTSSTLDSFFRSNPSIEKGKEVWIVDECSMVGNLHMERLLKLAQENEAKVVLMGDVKQLQSVSAGRAFWELQEHTMATYCEMNEVVRQKTVLAKRAVGYSSILRGDKALELLDEAGKVQSIANQSERMELAVAQYLSLKETGDSAVILTQTNLSRDIANATIRRQLVRDGSVQEGNHVSILSKVGITSSSGFLDSANYRKGMIVNVTDMIHGLAYDSRENVAVPAGVQAEIRGVSHESNRILISYSDKTTGKKVDTILNLLETGNNLQAYLPRHERFGAGDDILFTKNDKKFGVDNGDVGKITSIDGNGIITAVIGEDKREVRFNTTQYPYIDYGYAMTNHKAQGATYDSVVILCDKAERSSAEEWYVGVTRARNSVELFTDNLKTMKTTVRESKLNDSLLEELGMRPKSSPSEELDIVKDIISEALEEPSKGKAVEDTVISVPSISDIELPLLPDMEEIARTTAMDLSIKSAKLTEQMEQAKQAELRRIHQERLLREQQERDRIANAERLAVREKQFLERVYFVVKSDPRIIEMMSNQRPRVIDSALYERARTVLCELAKTASRDRDEHTFAERLSGNREIQTNMVVRMGVEIQKEIQQTSKTVESSYHGPSL